MKILIADKSRKFSEAIAEKLSDQLNIRVCDNGEQVLEICRLWQPDYMLLDLELPMKDGLTILRTLHSSGQTVQTLAKTSCIHSDYVGQSLVRMGVNYILANPCTVTEAVSQLNSMIQFTSSESINVDDEIVSLLLHLGFGYENSGFACLCEALRIMMYDAHLPVTKVVYPQVAHACGGSAVRVERAIRNAITRAWKDRDERIWQYYFTPGRDGRIDCPTNSAFISRVALCVNRRKIV